MSVNWYGVIAQRHWVRWLPKQYAAIGDPESFFTTLGEDVARQIDDLTDELVGEIRHYVGRQQTVGVIEAWVPDQGDVQVYLVACCQLLVGERAETLGWLTVPPGLARTVAGHEIVQMLALHPVLLEGEVLVAAAPSRGGMKSMTRAEPSAVSKSVSRTSVPSR
jgi:hypothetical protein